MLARIHMVTTIQAAGIKDAVFGRLIIAWEAVDIGTTSGIPQETLTALQVGTCCLLIVSQSEKRKGEQQNTVLMLRAEDQVLEVLLLQVAGKTIHEHNSMNHYF